MAIINLVLSIILCKFIGMTGVILGMAMFMLQIIELISEGKTEKISDIENEIENGTLVAYITKKYNTNLITYESEKK